MTLFLLTCCMMNKESLGVIVWFGAKDQEYPSLSMHKVLSMTDKFSYCQQEDNAKYTL